MKRYLTSWVIVAAMSLFFTQALCAEDQPVVGVAAQGQKVIELIARSEQNDNAVVHFGYLTGISGLSQEALFSDFNITTELTARFTFFATTKITSRHELGNIITTAAPGKLTIFFNETPGGNFNEPQSFAAGVPIATYTLRYHNTLNVQAQNEGILSAAADLLQESADSFTFSGKKRRLGHVGLKQRIEVAGQGTRTQIDPLQAFFLLGGHIINTGR
jgi:hypothetical protein